MVCQLVVYSGHSFINLRKKDDVYVTLANCRRCAKTNALMQNLLQLTIMFRILGSSHINDHSRRLTTLLALFSQIVRRKVLEITC
jgi:hypothetical protein